MSDDLTRAFAEALGCAPAGIYSATVPLAITGTWCVKHGQPHINNWPCPEAVRITAALAPLIHLARVREARSSAIPGSLYNRVMDLLLSHPSIDALYAAKDLKNAIGASAQRRAAREAKQARDA